MGEPIGDNLQADLGDWKQEADVDRPSYPSKYFLGISCTSCYLCVAVGYGREQG